MSYKMTKYEFVTEKNEQIETALTLENEPRSVIHGVVIDVNKSPVKDAVVKLFEMPNKEACCDLIPITHIFTDECGQFMFGPLTPGKRYVIKVWYNAVNIKRVQAKFFACRTPCSDMDHCDS